MKPLVRIALNSLTDLMREGHNPEEASDLLIETRMDPELVREAMEVYKDIARGVREMREPNVLVDTALVPQPWYTGPGPRDIFWPALEKYLSGQVGWNGSPLLGLDRSSTKVISYLAPPYSKSIKTRGLVVGYVQSGKTSNFTAVISKAADAGYRLFIVLSGIHNNLRRQTQLRLDEQLIDLNRELWIPLTTMESDFGTPIRATPLLAQPALRLLAIVKKNTTRLQRLTRWLNEANRSGVLERCPILVIDDEADQASPNTAAAALERATMNGLIMGLLQYPRVAYVGYTATPFANFFIDPKYPEDLYPRDFIVDLPRSEEYFGPERLFGLERLTSEDQEAEVNDMIRLVDPGELPALTPPRKKSEPFEPQVTKSMRSALLWFLLATTARRLREGTPRHTTMLIHTSDRVSAHEKLWKPVVDLLLNLNEELQRGEASIVEELRTLWELETLRVDPSDFGKKALGADSVIAGVPETIELLGDLSNQSSDSCGVVVDNSYSPKRLMYDDDNPLPVIVIGGNTLSRGLTLEGLVSSFFVRRVGTYDTLLQMGRWFGYRRNYEDLPRMWLTKDLMEQFRFLAGVEREIRQDIARYESEGLRPLDVAVRVRTHPSLAITAISKMRAVDDLKMSYSGQRPQTILFRMESRWLNRNLDAARRLIRTCIGSAMVSRIDKNNRAVFRDVPAEDILEFFDPEKGYAFHERSAELQIETLRSYIQRQGELGELRAWNVVILHREDKQLGTIDLDLGSPVGLMGRSKLAALSDTETANIGILVSQVDWVADLDVPGAAALALNVLRGLRDQSERAVLLLYPLSANAPPEKRVKISSRLKAAIDAPANLLGVSIAFPVARKDPTPQSYKVVRLGGGLDQALDDAIAEEEEQPATVGGADDGEGSLDSPAIPQ